MRLFLMRDRMRLYSLSVNGGKMEKRYCKCFVNDGEADSSLTNSGTITAQAGGFGVDEGAAFAGNEVIDENA